MRLQEEVRESSARSGYFIEQMGAGGETVQGLGMLETTDLCRHRDDRRPLRIVATLVLQYQPHRPFP